MLKHTRFSLLHDEHFTQKANLLCLGFSQHINWKGCSLKLRVYVVVCGLKCETAECECRETQPTAVFTYLTDA